MQDDRTSRLRIRRILLARSNMKRPWTPSLSNAMFLSYLATSRENAGHPKMVLIAPIVIQERKIKTLGKAHAQRCFVAYALSTTIGASCQFNFYITH